MANDWIGIVASHGTIINEHQPCDDCKGRGRDEGGYGYGERVCGTCKGTGLTLSPMDRQLVEGVLRAVRLHNEYGWR